MSGHAGQAPGPPAGSDVQASPGLRHTWATLALAAGNHPRVVQERLGHASVTVTLSVYAHVAPTVHTDAANTVAQLVADAEAQKAVDNR